MNLQQSFNDAVGKPLGEHVSLNKITLTFKVDNPAWASQLDFMKHRLLSTLSEHLGVRVADFDIILRRKDASND